MTVNMEDYANGESASSSVNVRQATVGNTAKKVSNT